MLDGGLPKTNSQVNLDGPPSFYKVALNRGAFVIGQEADARQRTEADKKRQLQIELQE